jgi:hypothetical protein
MKHRIGGAFRGWKVSKTMKKAKKYPIWKIAYGVYSKNSNMCL